MKRILTVIFGLALCLCVYATEPVDYVSTLVGTLSKRSLSTGNTYPAVAVPWGTHFWTPQTGKMGDGWAYVYTDDKIRGFKQTHQPSPWMNDYGQFSIMPVTGNLVFKEDERASWFSHKAEIATPYYYKVYLADYDCVVEMAPTGRAASFRITYPKSEMSWLVVDAYSGGGLSVQGNRITGFVSNNTGGVNENFRNYFIIESDTDFESVKFIDGNHPYAIVGYRTSKGQQVNLKVSSSFISQQQAAINMAELGDGDIDRISAQARKKWNEVLGRIQIDDDNLDHLRTFYSCLYRSLLFPRDFSEITKDGCRVHYSPHDGRVHSGYLFTDTGLWDTFRSLFALLNLVYPDQMEKIMQGYVNHYLESGLLPEWSSPGHRDCMVGNNSASVVAEAYLKGIGGADYELLWKALLTGAHCWREGSASGRKGWEWYDSLGYVPCDRGINESAARTLEYAYDDWCIWRMGQAMGKSQTEIGPYKQAAYNYAKLFKESAGWMAGRNADGSFPQKFNPLKWGGDFTEGNAIHYTWSVFHDPAGLAALMGGKDQMDATLDSVFTMPPIFDDSYYGSTIHEIREMQIMNMGNYAHGNQPIQHMLYLYNWCGKPWKTQARVREVMDKFYTAGPDGYCGDEDNGQTSAWYIFSAMGFYPVCPASCEYALGSPLFRQVRINLPSGKTIDIQADGNNSESVYVKTLKINGGKSSLNYVTHKQLQSGAKLQFIMSEHPDYSRGTSDTDAPYSLSK